MGDFKLWEDKNIACQQSFCKEIVFSDVLTFMEFQYVKIVWFTLKICPHFKFHKLSLSKGVGPLLRRNGRGLVFCAPLTYIPTLYYLTYTVAVYSWFIAKNFVIGVYCRCLVILCQIAFSSVAKYFKSYRKKQFRIKSVGIYNRHR